MCACVKEGLQLFRGNVVATGAAKQLDVTQRNMFSVLGVLQTLPFCWAPYGTAVRDFA